MYFLCMHRAGRTMWTIWNYTFKWQRILTLRLQNGSVRFCLIQLKTLSSTFNLMNERADWAVCSTAWRCANRVTNGSGPGDYKHCKQRRRCHRFTQPSFPQGFLTHHSSPSWLDETVKNSQWGWCNSSYCTVEDSSLPYVWNMAFVHSIFLP